MNKPSVTDPKLAEHMAELFRRRAKVGSGSTADAVRHELATGKKVGGRSHLQKAQDYIKALQRWLSDNPSAAQADIAAARDVLLDLENALKGN